MNGRKELKLAYIGAVLLTLPPLGGRYDNPEQSTFSNGLAALRATLIGPGIGGLTNMQPSLPNVQEDEKAKVLADWSQSWSQWSRSEYSRTNG